MFWYTGAELDDPSVPSEKVLACRPRAFGGTSVETMACLKLSLKLKAGSVETTSLCWISEVLLRLVRPLSFSSELVLCRF